MSALILDYRKRAVRMLRDPRALRTMLTETERLLRRPGHLDARWRALRESAGLLVDMLRSKIAGDYRDLSAGSLVLITAGLVYLAVPVDSVPDAIPVVGLLDDAMVLCWVATMLRDEIANFRVWRETRSAR